MIVIKGEIKVIHMNVRVQNQNVKAVNMVALNIHCKIYYTVMVCQNYEITDIIINAQDEQYPIWKVVVWIHDR